MTTDNLNRELQALLDKEIQKKDTHHVLLHVQSRDKSVDFCGAVGDVTTGTPYFIASITKMFTTTVIMQLVDEGKVDLDAPINRYLPSDMIAGIHVYKGTDYSQQLNVAQLIHQTSGLADYFEDKRDDGGSLIDDMKMGQDAYWDISDVLGINRRMTPKFAPDANDGKKSHYSDTNYQLLGAIIESVTGQSVADNFQHRIVERLGLRDTYLYDYQNLRDGMQPTVFYNKDVALNIPKAMSSFHSDGGIVSTLSDQMHFLRAYFDGDLFNPAHFPRMMKQWNGLFFPLQYGYGLMRFQIPRWMNLFRYSPELIGHSGASGSFAFSAPDEGLYIVGTFNQVDAPNRPYQFMLKVIQQVLSA